MEDKMRPGEYKDDIDRVSVAAVAGSLRSFGSVLTLERDERRGPRCCVAASEAPGAESYHTNNEERERGLLK